MEDEVQTKIIEITAELLGKSIDEIKPSSDFVKDLGADSLDQVELLMHFEEAFGVEPPTTDEKAENVTTVAEAVAYIKEQQHKQGK